MKEGMLMIFSPIKNEWRKNQSVIERKMSVRKGREKNECEEKERKYERKKREWGKSFDLNPSVVLTGSIRKYQRMGESRDCWYLGIKEEMLSQDSDPEMVDSGGRVLLLRSGGTIPGSRKFWFSYKLTFAPSPSPSLSPSLSSSASTEWRFLCPDAWRQLSWWVSRPRRFRLNVWRIRKNHIDMMVTLIQISWKSSGSIKVLILSKFWLNSKLLWNGKLL